MNFSGSAYVELSSPTSCQKQIRWTQSGKRRTKLTVLFSRDGVQSVKPHLHNVPSIPKRLGVSKFPLDRNSRAEPGTVDRVPQYPQLISLDCLLKVGLRFDWALCLQRTNSARNIGIWVSISTLREQNRARVRAGYATFSCDTQTSLNHQTKQTGGLHSSILQKFPARQVEVK